MKQIIVLIAMILLGISIAGFVTEFRGSAESLTDSTKEEIGRVITEGES